MLELGQSCLYWFRRHHFLYIFGFLMNFKPISPFIYEDLSETMHLNESTILRDVYPLANYSAAIFSLLTFLFAGFCSMNYAFIPIVISGLVVSVFYALMDYVFTSLQVVQCFYGIGVASEIFYFVSIYMLADSGKLDMLKLSSEIRAASLCGRMVAGLLGHTLIVQEWMSYRDVATFSIPACCHAALLLLHFPILEEDKHAPTKFSKRCSWIKSSLKSSLSKSHTFKLCLWYAFAICGNNLLSVYIQPIWRTAQIFNEDTHSNGVVEGVLALLSFLAVIVAGRTKVNWKYSDAILSVTFLIQAVLLLIVSGTRDVLSSYICYMLHGILFYFLTTCVSAEIAKNLPKGSVGITFCSVNLVAMLSNLIMVLFVTNFNSVYDHFLIFGIFHLLISILFAALMFYKFV